MGPNFEFFGPKTQCGPNSDPCRVSLHSIRLPSSCRPCIFWRYIFCISIIFAQVCSSQRRKRRVHINIYKSFVSVDLWNAHTSETVQRRCHKISVFMCNFSSSHGSNIFRVSYPLALSQCNIYQKMSMQLQALSNGQWIWILTFITKKPARMISISNFF